MTPRRGWALVALVALVLGSGFGPPQFLASDGGRLGLRPAEVRALQDYKSPVVTARAAVLLDAATGAVLYGKNAEERIPPASLTKMLTALVAVEHGRLDQRLTATEHVYVEPVVIGVDAGEVLSLQDLLYGLLVWSGNDAAVDIAEGLAGTLPKFAEWMNAKAAALGLRNSHFITPHGLDVPGHYSSAEDLARLLAAVMRDPVLARIVGTREYTIPGPPLYKFRNSNPLLGVYDGVDGGKTGLTDGCGRCLAVTAVRGGHRVIAVVLGSQDIARDGRTLLDFAFSNYEWVPVQGSALEPSAAASGSAAVPPGAARVVAMPNWESREMRTWVAAAGNAPSGQPDLRLIVESGLRRLGEFALPGPGAAP
ncbi:MAG TPA: D-alanyl-D-alanine carboxypeptidase family protein [Chloroflexota bacterium]|nr:D-alanyl-D-alanine carboxypeptidase family protein [Chloroflexota bacterium]